MIIQTFYTIHMTRIKDLTQESTQLTASDLFEVDDSMQPESYKMNAGDWIEQDPANVIADATNQNKLISCEALSLLNASKLIAGRTKIIDPNDISGAGDNDSLTVESLPNIFNLWTDPITLTASGFADTYFTEIATLVNYVQIESLVYFQGEFIFQAQNSSNFYPQIIIQMPVFNTANSHPVNIMFLPYDYDLTQFIAGGLITSYPANPTQFVRIILARPYPQNWVNNRFYKVAVNGFYYIQ